MSSKLPKFQWTFSPIGKRHRRIIIITFIVVVSHHHLHWHQQDKHRNQCNRCQSFILPSTHDCALSDAQSWVNWRKIVLASVELSRLLHMIFESLTAGLTRRDIWNLLDLYKIDLKNKIFSSSKGCLFPSNWEPITYFALLSYVGLGLNPTNTLYLL